MTATIWAVVAEREWQAVKAWRALAAAAEWSENVGAARNQASLHATLQALPARDIEVLTWIAPAGSAIRQAVAGPFHQTISYARLYRASLRAGPVQR